MNHLIGPCNWEVLFLTKRKEGEWNWGPVFVGFFRRGCSRGGGNWGTLRIDWGTLENIRED